MDLIRQLGVSLQRTVLRIGDIANKEGYGAYLIGGTVRDILLKKKNVDIDIAIEGDAIHLARILEKKLKAKAVFHKQFGTATLSINKGLRIDLVTARDEYYSKPGALPTVEPGSLEDDILRRDFSINAMAASLNNEDIGQLIDDHFGAEDLKKKLIRILHGKSFIDDPTRIFRAVRYEQRFGFKIEKETLRLLRNAVKKNCLKTVTNERLIAEVKKFLEEDDPVRCLRRLHLLKGTTFFDRNLDICWKKVGRLKRHFKTSSGWLFILFVFAQSIPKHRQKMFLSNFPLKKDEKTCLVQLFDSKKALSKISKKTVKPSGIYEALKDLNEDVIYYLLIQNTNKAVQPRIKKFLDKYRNVEIKINGDDLKKAGYRSGKVIGDVLKKILLKKIDGKIKTKQQELSLASGFLKG